METFEVANCDFKKKCKCYLCDLHRGITPEIPLDLEKHNIQYSPIEIRILKNTHDRFLIIDNNELYHLGAALKDLGKRWFAFSKMDSFLNEVLARLG